MTTDIQQSPWDAAANATEAQFNGDIFGQLELDVWFCVLQKGVGKIVYDPDAHSISQRRTAVDINIFDFNGLSFKRSFIAEIATDGWLRVTLPSLKALGVSNIQALNGQYVRAEMEAFGKFTGSDGIEKNRTAPRILAVYPTQEACEQAAQSANGAAGPNWLVNPQPVRAAAPVAPVAPQATGNDAEKAVALSFLPAIVRMAVEGNGINSYKLDAALKSNPILAKHFNLGSPEVMQAIQAALSEAAF